MSITLVGFVAWMSFCSTRSRRSPWSWRRWLRRSRDKRWRRSSWLVVELECKARHFREFPGMIFIIGRHSSPGAPFSCAVKLQYASSVKILHFQSTIIAATADCWKIPRRHPLPYTGFASLGWCGNEHHIGWLLFLDDVTYTKESPHGCKAASNKT